MYSTSADNEVVSLIFTYCVGSLAIACSIIRLRNMIYFRGVGDFTYQASMVPVWGAIECNAGIICGMFEGHLFEILCNEILIKF